ncbi:MAG TPA: DoxX family protein [Pseudolabrys sp.]|jgi:putative oxidoreductase
MTTTAISPTEQMDVRAAAGVNDAMLAVGRILIALIFVSSGIEKFIDLGATASAIGSKGLPYPNALAVLTAIVEFFGGVLIIVGWQTRLVALALAVFCAVAAYFFHDFWNMPSGQQHTNNMIHFMKNVSIIGGFLMLCAVGAGRYSLDGPCIRQEYLRS